MALTNLQNTKLGFLNTLEPNSYDIAYDPNDLVDPISANLNIRSQEDVFKRRNVFDGVSEFLGVVIQVDDKPYKKNTGLVNSLAVAAGITNTVRRYKIHVPEMHAALGNPCEFGYFDRAANPTEDMGLAEQIVGMHPWYITQTFASLFNSPTLGDIVKIKFAKGPSSGKQIEAQIIEVVGKYESAFYNTECEGVLTSLFNNSSNASTLAQASNPNSSVFTTGEGLEDSSLVLSSPFVGNYTVTSIVQYRRNFSATSLAKDPDLQSINGRPHAGTDYGMPVNTLLLACATGVVKYTNPSGGQLNILHYDAKTKTYYLAIYHHLSNIVVSNGQNVYRGQTVAYSGNTGLYSSGPHLHIEIRKCDANGTVFGYSSEEEFYSNVIDGRKAFSRPGVQYSASEAALVENEIAIATINSAIQATG